MEDENILDNHQIYLDTDEAIPAYLPELELEPNKQETVDWKPLSRRGGASFKTHQLIFSTKDCIKFTGTKRAYFFDLWFFIVGLVLILVGGFNYIFFLVLVGFIFALSGLSSLDSSSVPLIFNKRIGLYWKGRQPIISRLFTDKEGFSVNFEDIKAVQFLRESTTHGYSYEINLILTNNERLGVVNHSDEKSALKDAAKLAEFLDVPFLNGLDRIAK